MKGNQSKHGPYRLYTDLNITILSVCHVDGSVEYHWPIKPSLLYLTIARKPYQQGKTPINPSTKCIFHSNKTKLRQKRPRDTSKAIKKLSIITSFEQKACLSPVLAPAYSLQLPSFVPDPCPTPTLFPDKTATYPQGKYMVKIYNNESVMQNL